MECEIYTHVNSELNAKISILMNEWRSFMKKVKYLGLDVRLHPESETLELYFNDDYPDTLLVDKYFSEQRREECVCYGKERENDICIECLTCNEVLISAETFEFEEENE